MLAVTEAFKSGLFTRSHWLNNIIAGIIVGIVALPLGMAFAIASGAKPEQGIYTSIIAGFCTAVFGGSRLQISGPTGAFIVVLSGITAQYGIEGLQVATLMAGVILLAFGLTRMGAIIKYIPSPVIVGFTAGIAVIIWVGQWQDFFGLPNVNGDHFHLKLFHLLQAFPQFHFTTALLAVFALLLVLYSSKIPGFKRIPGPLIALLVISLIQFVFQFDGVKTIGSAFGGIPQGLPEFKIPSLSWTNMIELIGPAFTIAMLGAIESLLSAVVADGMAGTRHNSNQELVGQGIANIAAPLFGGFAATGAIARTATNIRNGATSPLSGIIHSVTLVVILLVLAPLAVHIPLAVLSAILFVVAWNMSEAKRFLKMIKRAPKSDVAILVITFGLTVFADLVVAVNIGVILATLLFLRRMAGSVEVKRLSQADLLARIGIETLPEELLVFTVDGPFFFGAVENFNRALGDSQTYPKYLIIRLKWVPFIDMTGIQSLENVIDNLQNQGVTVMLSGANHNVTQKLRRGGIIQLVGEHNTFKLFDDALRTAQSELKQIEDNQA
ncbi:sodium-independent anion transporter [Chelonobacter oris]|uniref:SulP family inorganic anion transporter n=1 Tax=Chelonobacter oris TaxID=505317 RepID=UPI00244AEA65|nr:SulP family inorganic anion transporter [Chelonobacter oris]MDH2999425.1 sodium-independent anion transporter [Chelonobacter oris]